MNPRPPYYAVIFTNKRTAGDHGYSAMAERMMELASRQPGFLGADHAREEIGITVSYWESLEAIASWKAHPEHVFAREQGRKIWYSHYSLRICKVEREYNFDRM